MPHGEQCKEFDIDSEIDAIRFMWRGEKFRISCYGGVEQVGDGILRSNDLCRLMSHIIKLTLLKKIEV